MATVKRENGFFNIGAAILMILAGIFMGLVGGYFLFQSYQLSTRGLQVNAVVVDLVQSPSDRTAAPIYEYTVDGESYRFRSKTKSYPHLLIGDHQTLIYDPKNPARATENTFSDLWLLPSITCIASPLLLLGAVIVVVAGKLLKNVSS